MHRIIPLLGLLATACGGGIAVNTDFDPLAGPRMEAWKAWTWMNPVDPASRQSDSAVATQVTGEIERQLATLGYRKEDRAPEFRVGWHVLLNGEVDVTTVNERFGYAWGRWFPGGGVAYSRGFQTAFALGTLIVDVADVRSNELVWRGIAREVFTGKRNQAEQSVALNQAVTRLLLQFPPTRPERPDTTKQRKT
jgi:hypothetical protein